MMNCYGVLATREHMLTGQPITRLEAMLLYGMPDLTKLVSDLRRDGFELERETVTFADAIARMEPVAQVQAPAALPITKIKLTQYRVIR